MNSTTIKFSRSGYIEQSYDVALIRLNEFTHIVGQPVVVRYRTADSKVNAITAIGILDGVGRDKYKIISNGEVVPVNRIYQDRIEDISQLIHQELVVCRYNNVLYFCQSEDGVLKKLSQITTDTVFYNGADGFHWYYNAETDVLKRADDFMTTAEVTENFEKLTALITNLSSSIFGGNGSQEGNPGGDNQGGGEGSVVVAGNNLVKCTFSVFPTSLLYTGEDVEITVSFGFTFLGDDIVPKSLKILRDSEVVYNIPEASNNITLTINKRGTTTFTIQADVDVAILSTTEQQSIEQRVDVFMYPTTKTALSPSETINQVSNWGSNPLSSYPNSVTVTGNENGYLWFAIPEELAFKNRFLMSSIEFEVMQVGVNDGYTYYRTLKQQVPGSYKIRLE